MGGHVLTCDMVTSATTTVVVVQDYYDACADLQQAAGCVVIGATSLQRTSTTRHRLRECRESNQRKLPYLCIYGK